MSDATSTPAENPIILNLTNSSGALLIGSFLSCAMWGASSIQTFLYFRNYETDPRSLRYLVSALWVLDTVNEILVLKSNWIILIQQWGRISNLDVSQPELMHHTWVESMVVFAVQVYFIRRIYLFTNKRKVLLPAFLIFLSSWQMIGTVVYQIIGYGRPLTNLSTPREVGLNMSLRACAVAVDIIVTISMVYLLTRRGAPKFARSKQMVYRLIMIVINSGMVTAIFACATLILLAAQPDNLLYNIPELALCSLYYSTFLANLNARRYVKGEGGVSTFSHLSGLGDKATTNSNTLVLSPMGGTKDGHPLEMTKGSQDSKATGMVINVETDTSVMTDDCDAAFDRSKNV